MPTKTSKGGLVEGLQDGIVLQALAKAVVISIVESA
jgi:hypothetical protein